MIIAIPIFGSEISPRFDLTKKFLLARVEGGQIAEIAFKDIEETNPIKRAKNLLAWKVDKVICNGIDDFSSRLLQGMGINVIPLVSGEAEEVLNNYVKESGPSHINSAMVVGGGVAGIQSALDLAQAGYLVYLVEKSAGIGGVMAQLDKTFPTNECST